MLHLNNLVTHFSPLFHAGRSSFLMFLALGVSLIAHYCLFRYIIFFNFFFTSKMLDRWMIKKKKTNSPTGLRFPWLCFFFFFFLINLFYMIWNHQERRVLLNTHLKNKSWILDEYNFPLTWFGIILLRSTTYQLNRLSTFIIWKCHMTR